MTYLDPNTYFNPWSSTVDPDRQSSTVFAGTRRREDDTHTATAYAGTRRRAENVSPPVVETPRPSVVVQPRNYVVIENDPFYTPPIPCRSYSPYSSYGNSYYSSYREPRQSYYQTRPHQYRQVDPMTAGETVAAIIICVGIFLIVAVSGERY